MKNILLTLLIIASLASNAQNVLLHKEVNQDTLLSDFGANRKHFLHGYVNYGFPFSINNSSYPANYKPFNSPSYSTGIRYKRKIKEWYSLVFDFSYNSTKYFFLPSTNLAVYEKERVIFNQFEGGISNRISFGKRGNIIGKYIDVGGFASYAISTKHSGVNTKKTLANNFPGSKSEMITYNLSYANKFNYGLNARIGTNKIAVFAKYHISPLLSIYKMPNFILGLDFSLGG